MWVIQMMRDWRMRVSVLAIRILRVRSEVAHKQSLGHHCITKHYTCMNL